MKPLDKVLLKKIKSIDVPGRKEKRGEGGREGKGEGKVREGLGRGREGKGGGLMGGRETMKEREGESGM